MGAIGKLCVNFGRIGWEREAGAAASHHHLIQELQNQHRKNFPNVEKFEKLQAELEAQKAIANAANERAEAQRKEMKARPTVKGMEILRQQIRKFVRLAKVQAAKAEAKEAQEEIVEQQTAEDIQLQKELAVAEKNLDQAQAINGRPQRKRKPTKTWLKESEGE
jgi:hypothetical protein